MKVSGAACGNLNRGGAEESLGKSLAFLGKVLKVRNTMKIKTLCAMEPGILRLVFDYSGRYYSYRLLWSGGDELLSPVDVMVAPWEIDADGDFLPSKL
jgi:hypothetical protein